jgi:signal transduction histidine kinase
VLTEVGEVIIPHIWRFSISAARVVVALSFLVIYYLSIRSLVQLPGLIFLTYFLYSVASLWWRPLPGKWGAIVIAVADALMSLFWVAIYSGALGNPQLWFWVSVGSWIFVLAKAQITQETWLTAVLSLFALVILFLIPSASSTNLTAVVVGGGALAVIATLQKRQYDHRLAHMGRQNVLLRSDAQRARDLERQRIAADFHDGPLQAFIGFLMRLELLRRLMGKDLKMAMEELVQLQGITKQQVNDLRAFVRSMRPADVDGESLAGSVSRLVDQFHRETGIAATYSAGDFDEPPETEVALEIMQIVREALNNVQKHSKATRVMVSLGKNLGALELTVDDNGGGFPFGGQYTLDELDLMRLGPVSIKRRVRTLGGDLTIDSRPGEGAGLRIRVAAS